MTQNTAATMLDILNPYNLETVDTIAVESAASAARVFAAARDLHRDRRNWLARADRIAVLEKAANIIGNRADSIAAAAVHESGMLVRNARASLAWSIGALREYAAQLRMNPQEVRAPRSEVPYFGVLTSSDPVGVVFATSNSADPFDPFIHQILPAVAAGCPVIACPNQLVPLTSRALTSTLHEAGLPADWAWCWITEDCFSIEDRLPDKEPDLHSHIGLSLGDPFNPPPAIASIHRTEGTGRANVIVTGDVDIYQVRDSLLSGCFTHSGQDPGSVQRVFAHTRVATRLATQMAMRASGLHVGDPICENVEVGPVLGPVVAAHLDDLVHEATAGGGQLLTGGKRLSETLYAPTILFNAPNDCRLMTTNVTGPVTCVSPWFETDDVLQRVNALSPLSRVAVYGCEIGATLEIARSVTASTVFVNEHPAQAPNPPNLAIMQRPRTTTIRARPLQPSLDTEPA